MKSKRILFFLIPAFIAALIYSYLQMPNQERIPPGEKISTTPRSPVTIKQQGKKLSSTQNAIFPRLRTDLLEYTPQPYPGVRRDLFFTVNVQNEVEEEIEIIFEEPPEVVPPPIIVPVATPPSPQEIARQEVARYKFLGFFKKGEKKTIFLSTDGEVLLVRQGEYLGRERKYYVVNITDTTLELRTAGAGDFLVKLNEEESLSAIPLRAPQPPPSRQSLQEGYLPDQPVIIPVPVEELSIEDQPQFEEENNENQP